MESLWHEIILGEIILLANDFTFRQKTAIIMPNQIFRKIQSFPFHYKKVR